MARGKTGAMDAAAMATRRRRAPATRSAHTSALACVLLMAVITQHAESRVLSGVESVQPRPWYSTLPQSAVARGASQLSRLEEAALSGEGLALIERGFTRATRFVRRLGNFVRRFRYECLAALGLLGLMRGGQLSYTVLFVRTFGASGWPALRSAAARLEAIYTAAMQDAARRGSGVKERMAELQGLLTELALELADIPPDNTRAREAVLERMRAARAELERLATSPPPGPDGQSGGSSSTGGTSGTFRRVRPMPLLLALLDPALLRDVGVGVWTGVSVSLAAASSTAARSLGIGITIGEFIAAGASKAIDRAELLLRQMLSRLPPEAVALSYLGPSSQLRALIWVFGRWAGCAFAFRLQDLAMQLSVGLVSASALIEGIEQTLATRTGARVHWEAGRRDATQWLLAAASLSALYTRSTRPPLPLLAQAALLPARLLLLPVDGIERLLRHLSRRLAKEDFLNSLSGPPTPLPKGFRF